LSFLNKWTLGAVEPSRLMRKPLRHGSENSGNRGPLVAFSLLKLTFRSAAIWRPILIVSRHTHIGQRNRGTAHGTVIVVALQSHDRNAWWGTALGTGYKCFASCHTCISSLSRANPRKERAFGWIFPCCARNTDWTSKNLGMTLDGAYLAWRTSPEGCPDFEKWEAPVLRSLIVGFSQSTASLHFELAVLWGPLPSQIQRCRLH